jgi:hypothetical protein
VVAANPNLLLILASFSGLRPKDDHFVHIGSPRVHGGVGLAETDAHQRDLHSGQPSPRGRNKVGASQPALDW